LRVQIPTRAINLSPEDAEASPKGIFYVPNMSEDALSFVSADDN
jgi:hypothetical protein